MGNQLLLLQQLGYSNLHGVDIQSHALEMARSRTKNVNLAQASSFALPYEDKYFDLIFTSGVLIHISPKDIPAALERNSSMCKELHLGIRVLRTGRFRNQLSGSQ